MTTKGNNAALDAIGAGGEDLSPAIGLSFFVQVVNVRNRDGNTKASIQIAEITKDGKSIWATTKS